MSLPVPRIIAPKRHMDARGWFSESFNDRRLAEIGISCHFVQDNQSKSKNAGTLRGLHFQCPPAAQAKLVSVISGRVLDVAVDLRRGSPTFGKYVVTELSAESGRQHYIPVGFAHGFLTLVDNVEVMYKVSNCETTSPPTTANPSGRRASDPAPNPKAMGSVPISAAIVVIMIGRKRTRQASWIASAGGMP